MLNQPARTAGQGANPCAHHTAEPAQEPQEPHRDPFLNPWRTCQSPAAERLLQLLTGILATRETETSPRQRERRYADQVLWDGMAEALIAALALQVLTGGGPLVIPLSHRHKLPARYRRPTQGDKLPDLVALLEGCGLVEFVKGTGNGAASTIAPSSLMADLVYAHGLGVWDFGHRADRTLIVLRHSTRANGKREKRLVDYLETATTAALHQEVVGHNDHLARADIGYVGNGNGVDVGDRQLRRYFTVLDDGEPAFDLGGRLFGGFWQRLKKAERRHLRINGELVAEVDYSAAFAHIAFALQGVEAPAVADLYDIPGLEGLGRTQIKSALNTLLFDQHRHRRTWPEEFQGLEWSDPDTGEVFDGFPAEFTPSRVRAAIAKHYPVLGRVMGMGIGYRLMFIESEIMSKALNALHERGLVGLPLHDALVVPRSAAPIVSSLMKDMAMEVTGYSIPVKYTYSLS